MSSSAEVQGGGAKAFWGPDGAQKAPRRSDLGPRRVKNGPKVNQLPTKKGSTLNGIQNATFFRSNLVLKGPFLGRFGAQMGPCA